MIFKIVNFNKDLDIYAVISNEGEQKNVTSLQIVRVLLQGYKFDNAYLTQKGFALQTNAGTRYIQVRMDKQTQMQVAQFLNAIKAQEQQRIAEQKRLEEEARRLAEQRRLEEERFRKEAEALRLKQAEEQKKQQQAQQRAASDNKATTKIQGNAGRGQKIMYRGDLYLSEAHLCKKFNADVENFKALRAKGYSIDESLGLKPLRPEEELMSLKQLNRVLDSMAAQRGEY